MADFSRRAPRCVLVNVSTGESMECQFNPAKLVEKVSVGWSRLTVPGLGRQIVQFQSTGDREFPSVEFWLDRTVPDAPDTADFVAFLRSLTVPFPGAAERGPGRRGSGWHAERLRHRGRGGIGSDRPAASHHPADELPDQRFRGRSGQSGVLRSGIRPESGRRPDYHGPAPKPEHRRLVRFHCLSGISPQARRRRPRPGHCVRLEPHPP